MYLFDPSPWLSLSWCFPTAGLSCSFLLRVCGWHCHHSSSFADAAYICPSSWVERGIEKIFPLFTTQGARQRYNRDPITSTRTLLFLYDDAKMPCHRHTHNSRGGAQQDFFFFFFSVPFYLLFSKTGTKEEKKRLLLKKCVFINIDVGHSRHIVTAIHVSLSLFFFFCCVHIQ